MQGWLLSSFICLGSLIALTGLKQFLLAPVTDPLPNTLWFIAQILPLLAPLPGLMSGSIRATFVLCMASLLYFMHGVVVCFEPGMVLYGSSEIVFSLGLCATTAILVRRLREQAASEGQGSSD